MRRALTLGLGALLWLACSTLLLACSTRYRETMPLPTRPLAATGADAIPDPPPPGVAPEPSIEPFESMQLENGLTVVIAPRPHAPSVTLRYTSRAAASRDDRAYRGLTSMTTAVMMRATEYEDGHVEPRVLANHGFGVSTSTTVDGTSITQRLPTAFRVSEFFERLAPVIASPAFRDEDVQAVLRDRADTARSAGGNYSAIRDRWLRRAIYDTSDRRSRDPSGGTPAVERTTVELLRSRHAQAFIPAQSAIFVVGPVDPVAVRAQIAAAFGGWTSSHTEPARISDPVYAPDEGARALGVSAGVRQAQIQLWERAPPWGHADYPAFVVLTKVLGGLMLSRMNMEIRERRGASYGVQARLLASSTDTELEITTAIDPDLTGHVVSMIVRELARVCGEHGGIEPDELEMARAVAREGYLASIETTSGLARALSQAFRAGVPPTHLTDVVARIDALTLDEIHETARRWIRPGRAPMVVLAPWMQVHGALQQAGIGAVETRELPRWRRD